MKNKVKHIFIVDDDEFILWTLKAKFEKEHYKVTTSSNVDDAYFKVNFLRPSVVLLDIILPGMNGLDFMSAVHDKLEADKVPVVIMSSVSQQSVVKIAYQMGAKAYMAKPFSMDYAYELVNRVAENKSMYSS